MGNSLFEVLIAAVFLLFVARAFAETGSLRLAWNANPETDIAGYRLYSGTVSGVYTREVDVQQGTAVTLTDLTIGIRYYCVVRAYNTAGLESPPSAEVSTIVTTPSPSKILLNVSTRARVQGGDSVMISGFIVTGDTAKKVVLRAIGPSLAAAGVPGVLEDPLLELYDATGALIAQNDNWSSLSEDIIASGLTPTDPAESVIAPTLAPGNYTSVLKGVNGSSGVALGELYDFDPSHSRISNISTRGQVGTENEVLIGGFIIGGADPAQIILRAIGPSLGAFGVVGALPDPILELRDSEGSLIFENDDWRSDQEQQIIDTTIPPTDDREAAIVATLPPGNYTAVISGQDNTTGIALVEVYDLE